MIDGNTVKKAAYAIAAVVLISFAAVYLLPHAKEYWQKNNRLEKKREEARQINRQLQKKIKETQELENSPHAIEKVAREKYRQVGDGETVLVYNVPVSKGKK